LLDIYAEPKVKQIRNFQARPNVDQERTGSSDKIRYVRNILDIKTRSQTGQESSGYSNRSQIGQESSRNCEKIIDRQGKFWISIGRTTDRSRNA